VIRRREFITLLGGAAASSLWPLAARAQQPALPVVGYLGFGSPATTAARGTAAFRKGLGEGGFVEGQNVAIEYRWTEAVDRLPELAADLVRRQVAVIATSPSTAAGVAAKAATTTIPIVFNVGGDPVQLGLVTNLNRPGGNVTGMSFLSADVVAKNLQLLHEAAPNATIMAALVNPQNPIGEPNVRQAQEAARILGLQLHVFYASNEREVETAFINLVQQGTEALLIDGDPLFIIRQKQLVALTVRHALPAIYQGRDFPDAGGLMSYGADRYDAERQAGTYVGRILKGERPAGLPVQQSVKIELVINLVTAKAIGLTIPPTLIVRADEVIE
jgi:putative tryptophan/tyrosine transport system substrate-binding protein